MDKILIKFNSIMLKVEQFADNSKILFPLLLSIISAIIFWLIFSYIPNKIRYKKIRPIVELYFYHLHNKLFQLFDMILRHNSFSPSFYQDKIYSGTLTEYDFYIGLQNKCLNDTYLYDKFISKYYDVIGEKLLEISKDIENIIEKIINYSEFTKSDELTLLESLRNDLNKYGLLKEKIINEEAGSIINNQRHYPVVSNLYYLRENIYHIYEKYKQIQKIVFEKNSFENRDIAISKVRYFYNTKQYKKCKKFAKKFSKIYTKDRILFKFYEILSEFKLKRKINYNILELLLKKYKGNLVSIRSFLKHLLFDEKFQKLLLKYYSDIEISRLKKVIQDEEDKQKQFYERNIQIKNYFEKKDPRLKMKKSKKDNKNANIHPTDQL